MEAIKFLSGIGTNLLGRLLIWDGDQMELLNCLRKSLQIVQCAGEKDDY